MDDDRPGAFSVLSRTFRQSLLLHNGMESDRIGEHNLAFLARLVMEGWAFHDSRGVWLTPLGVRELIKSVREEQP